MYEFWLLGEPGEFAVKAVFDVRPEPKFESNIAGSYKFRGKSDYLAIAQACIDDWVIFRETKAKGGRGAYIAAALVQSIEPDPLMPGYCYARILNYLPFDEPVPLKNNGRYEENDLRTIPRSVQIGQAFQGKALRNLSDHDFEKIVRAGLSIPDVEPDLANASFTDRIGLAEGSEKNGLAFRPRRFEDVLLHRPFRTATFRKQVGAAYDFTCAVTKFRNRNGVGHHESQGAHIWSVESGGPDLIQNGLSLCQTAHWLFDNFAFTINPDYTLRLLPHLIDPRCLAFFLPEGEIIHLPRNEKLWPHAEFLNRHRAEFDRRLGLT